VIIKINKITRLYKRYGVKGLSLYAGIKNKKNKLVSFFYPTEFAQPIYLRTTTSDYSIFIEVIFGKSYDFPLKFTPKVIIDCGANIGLASVFFKNKYPSAKIIAVEPEKENFEILSKNLNNYNNTILYNNGIWNKSARLKIEDNGSGSLGFMVYESEENNTNAITSISIKDILLQNNIDTIDILKIDIEGSEKELFESNYDYWLPRTKLISIELHDRMRKGCSQSFFSAISKYNFEIAIKGQSIFCFLGNQ